MLTSVSQSLEPFEEVGANFPQQLTFIANTFLKAKIDYKKVFPQHECEKHIKASLGI